MMSMAMMACSLPFPCMCPPPREHAQQRAGNFFSFFLRFPCCCVFHSFGHHAQTLHSMHTFRVLYQESTHPWLHAAHTATAAVSPQHASAWLRSHQQTNSNGQPCMHAASQPAKCMPSQTPAQLFAKHERQGRECSLETSIPLLLPHFPHGCPVESEEPA